MTVVESWNKDVEKAFQRRIDSQSNEELRSQIRKLNDFLETQGETISKLNSQVEKFQKGQQWLEASRSGVYREIDSQMLIERYKGLYHQSKSQADMAAEDMLVMKIQKMETQENHQNELNKLLESSRLQHMEQEDRINRLNIINKDLSNKANDLDMRMVESSLQVNQWQKEVLDARAEVSRMERVRDQLLLAMDEKDKMLSEYREEAIALVESLKHQVSDLIDDQTKLQNENEKIKLQADSLRERVSKLEDEIENMKHQRLQYLPSTSFVETSTQNDEPEEFDMLERLKSVIGILPKSLRKTISMKIKKEAPADVSIMEKLCSDDESGGSSLFDEHLSDSEDVNQIQQTKFEKKKRSNRSSKSGAEEDAQTETTRNSQAPPRWTVIKPSDLMNANLSDSLSVESSEKPLPAKSRPSFNENSRVTKLAGDPEIDLPPVIKGPPKVRRTVKRSTVLRSSSSTSIIKEEDSSQSASLIKKKSSSNVPSGAILEEDEDSVAIHAYKPHMSGNHRGYHDDVADMLQLLAPYMYTEKRKLRSVAIAVIFMVRLKKAIDTSDFEMFGSCLGRKEHLRRLQQELDEKKSHILEQEKTILDLQRSVSSLHGIKFERDNEIGRQNIEIDELKNRNTALRQLLHDAKAVTRQQHIMGQWNRSMAHSFGTMLQALRRRMYVLTGVAHNESQQQLDKFFQLESQSVQNEIFQSSNCKDNNDQDMSTNDDILNSTCTSSELSNELSLFEEIKLTKLKRKRVTYLLMKFKRCTADIVKWSSEHKRDNPVYPFQMNYFPDFKAFSSKLKNEERSLKFFYNKVWSDFELLEAKYKIISFEYKSLLCEKSNFESNLKNYNSTIHSDDFRKGIKSGDVGDAIATAELDEENNSKNAIQQVVFNSMVDEERLLALKEENMKMAEDYREISLRATKLQLELDRALDDRYNTKTLLSEAQDNIAILNRQNKVLRRAIQDSYRVSADVEPVAVIEEEEVGPPRPSLVMESKGTQVSCSVCAIRDFAHSVDSHRHEALLLDDDSNNSDKVLIAKVVSFLHRVESHDHEHGERMNTGRKGFNSKQYNGVRNIVTPPDSRAKARPISAKAAFHQLESNIYPKDNKFRHIRDIPMTSGGMADRTPTTCHEYDIDEKGFTHAAALIQRENIRKIQRPISSHGMSGHNYNKIALYDKLRVADINASKETTNLMHNPSNFDV